jgi:hypothetical protein
MSARFRSPGVVLAALGLGLLVLGTIAGAAPPATATRTTTTTTTTTSAGVPHPPGARCDACHTPAGWKPAKFAHEATGFALAGRHAGVACTSCHRREWQEPVPQSCAGCHVDPHAQEFGLLCRACHSEEGWQPLFLVDAHRRTQFPLSGRHATLPCEECHVEKRERTFTRTALACVSCHARDAARASASTLDHRALSSSCQSCHVPTSFSPARLAEHEVCFPLASTVHAPVRCSECHNGAALVGARVTGGCRGVPVRCAECHAHAKGISDRQHRGVVGYAHASEKCAGCHQAVR